MGHRAARGARQETEIARFWSRGSNLRAKTIDVLVGLRGNRMFRRSLLHAIITAAELVERDADALVVAPDRMAAADELIGLDQKHE
jgi:hypothetical protein